jgi:hypothetical protein
MAAINSPNFDSARGVHINQVLTSMSIGYHPTGFVAEQMFPVVPVAHESDYYQVWDKGQAFRVTRSDGKGSLRADGAPSMMVDFGATPDIYKAEAYAYKTRITDRQRQNQDSVLQLEVSKVRRTQDDVLIDQELRVANILTATGTYTNSNTTTLSGTSQWNNASFSSQAGSQSVIEQQFDNAREAIRKNTGGLDANIAVIPMAVWRVMARDTGIRDQIKYTHNDILSDGTLPPTLWGLKLVVPRSMYATSGEGEAPSLIDCWGKNVVIAYVDPNPGLDGLTLGATFRARPWQVKQWREENLESTFYEPSIVQAEKLIAQDCGYLINACIA